MNYIMNSSKISYPYNILKIDNYENANLLTKMMTELDIEHIIIESDKNIFELRFKTKEDAINSRELMINKLIELHKLLNSSLDLTKTMPTILS